MASASVSEGSPPMAISLQQVHARRARVTTDIASALAHIDPPKDEWNRWKISLENRMIKVNSGLSMKYKEEQEFYFQNSVRLWSNG